MSSNGRNEPGIRVEVPRSTFEAFVPEAVFDEDGGRQKSSKRSAR